MDKVFCKRPFMKLQLLVITGITVFMFIPPTFSCEITEVTLYAGADAPDAEEADCETFYIGKNGDVVFHAICEGVTNPDELEIKWKFNFDNGGTTVDYSDETSYDSDGDYLKNTSSTASYDTAGTIWPSVTCYFIDSSGAQVGDSVSDSCTVRVVSVNIQMQSLLEEDAVDPPHEEDPGALVAKNQDDDNGNGNEDLDDAVVAGGDYDLIPATLSITPATVNVGEIVLSPSAGTTIKVYEWQDKLGGPEYSWDMSIFVPGITVYVEGFDTGTENLKIAFKYDHDDDGDDDELCDDHVKVTVAEAEIVSVPKYLFAGATYAIPIKFNLNGMGSKVWITGITGKFYCDMNGDGNISPSTEGVSLTIGDRFVAGSVSGGAERLNGTSSTYTALAKPSDLSSIDITGSGVYSTDDGFFIINVTCQEYTGSATLENGDTPDSADLGPSITLSSKAEPYDDSASSGPWNKIRLFAESAVFAAEPKVSSGAGTYYAGTGDYNDVPITSTTQAAVQFDTGEGTNTHLSASTYFPDSCTATFSHTCTTLPSGGCCGLLYVYWPGTSITIWSPTGTHNVVKYHAASDKMYANLELSDSTMSAQDFKYKLTNYGCRRGGYFYASYGGVALDSGVHAPLDSGEFAMDLTIVSGNYIWELFPDGKIQFHNTSRVNSSSGIAASVGTASTILWAATPPGPWDIAFATVSAVAALVAAEEGTVATGSAFGVASLYYAIDSDTGTEYYHQEDEKHKEDNGSILLSLETEKTDIWNVGHQYTLTVNLDANLQNETSILGSTVQIEMEYYQPGDDLDSMKRLEIYP